MKLQRHVVKMNVSVYAVIKTTNAEISQNVIVLPRSIICFKSM